MTGAAAVDGDVNGDGHVSSVDVTVLYNYLLNGDGSNILHGDQDGDGHISSVDITYVYKILLGSGTRRVLRGGSFARSANECRVSCRDGWNPTGQFSDVGLRLAM